MNHHIYQPRSNRGRRSVKTHLLNTNKFGREGWETEREREGEREIERERERRNTHPYSHDQNMISWQAAPTEKREPYEKRTVWRKGSRYDDEETVAFFFLPISLSTSFDRSERMEQYSKRQTFRMIYHGIKHRPVNWPRNVRATHPKFRRWLEIFSLPGKRRKRRER